MRFRSPLLSQSRFLSFPPGTEMVHFPGFARARLWIHRAVLRFYPSGFPHSEIPGSMPACGSPRLIAACHVLHRLLLPRHSPCALSSLTIKFTRHTAVARATHRKRYGPLPLYRNRFQSFKVSRSLGLQGFRLETLKLSNLNRGNLLLLSGHIQALIKIYIRLVDCPIYSVVKHRPLSLRSYPPGWISVSSFKFRVSSSIADVSRSLETGNLKPETL